MYTALVYLVNMLSDLPFPPSGSLPPSPFTTKGDHSAFSNPSGMNSAGRGLPLDSATHKSPSAPVRGSARGKKPASNMAPRFPNDPETKTVHLTFVTDDRWIFFKEKTDATFILKLIYEAALRHEIKTGSDACGDDKTREDECGCPPSGINSAGLRLKPAPNTSPCSSYNQTKKKNADLIRRLRANMERGNKRKRLTPDNSANTTHINAAE